MMNSAPLTRQNSTPHPARTSLLRRYGLTSLVLLPLALAACANAGAPPPVPPLQAETIPKPPVTATALIWQPGHWNWNGSGYDWAAGEYVPAAGHGNLWMPGYWAAGPGGAGAPLVWQPAHWE